MNKFLRFVLIGFIIILWQPGPLSAQIKTIELNSSDTRLNEAFSWAKETAFSYVSTGNDPVGKWYEAALPQRESFCMRDVSHQATGAYFLGLKDYNKNMLSKFSQYISPKRDWCSYWEITKDNTPTPVDYTSDKDFWYNLPANFDVMYACSKMFALTGDSDYLLAEPFYSFHYHSVNEYSKTWDSDNDGIMNARNKSRRGIPSYSEGRPEIFTGADLPSAQAKGYTVYAQIMELMNKPDSAKIYYGMAEKIRETYEKNWWNPQANSFYSYKTEDGNFGGQPINFLLSTILHFDLVKDKDKIGTTLIQLEKGGLNVEENSYLPMIFYKYNKPEIAYNRLLAMADPSVKRRTYPEVSYVFVGTVVEGLLGAELNAPENMFQTAPKLPNEMKWLELKNIPWKNGFVTVKHISSQSTTLTSDIKQPFTWRAVIPGNQKTLWVNHKQVKAQPFLSQNFKAGDNGNTFIYVDVIVKPGESYTVSITKK